MSNTLALAPRSAKTLQLQAICAANCVQRPAPIMHRERGRSALLVDFFSASSESNSLWPVEVLSEA